MTFGAALSLVAPALMLQTAAMLTDEAVFHRRRGLPRWERIGHPIDTLATALCYAWLLAKRPSSHALFVYAALALGSSLLITKDEFVHARQCCAGEHWLHALLFVLHPIVLVSFGWLWWFHDPRFVLVAQLALTSVFLAYQVLYWSVLWKPVRPPNEP